MSENYEIDWTLENITAFTITSASNTEETSRYSKLIAAVGEGDWNTVIAEAEEILRTIKDDAKATFWLGYGYYEDKQYANALEQFGKLVRNQPIPNVLLYMSLCHYYGGDKLNARDFWNRAHDLLNYIDPLIPDNAAILSPDWELEHQVAKLLSNVSNK